MKKFYPGQELRPNAKGLDSGWARYISHRFVFDQYDRYEGDRFMYVIISGPKHNGRLIQFIDNFEPAQETPFLRDLHNYIRKELG